MVRVDIGRRRMSGEERGGAGEIWGLWSGRRSQQLGPDRMGECLLVQQNTSAGVDRV